MRKFTSKIVMVIPVLIFLVHMNPNVFADTDAPDEILMENRAYEKHSKGIVVFSHKKHSESYAVQYPDVFKNGCGACHHDKDNVPLSLKPGDGVQPCIECHSKPGEKPKGKGAPKLSSKEQLQYHAEAVHANCRGCHREINRTTGKKAAPTTCAKCHPRK